MDVTGQAYVCLLVFFSFQSRSWGALPVLKQLQLQLQLQLRGNVNVLVHVQVHVCSKLSEHLTYLNLLKGCDGSELLKNRSFFKISLLQLRII
jgi:hypothetical protein